MRASQAHFFHGCPRFPQQVSNPGRHFWTLGPRAPEFQRHSCCDPSCLFSLRACDGTSPAPSLALCRAADPVSIPNPPLKTAVNASPRGLSFHKYVSAQRLPKIDLGRLHLAARKMGAGSREMKSNLSHCPVQSKAFTEIWGHPTALSACMPALRG